MANNNDKGTISIPGYRVEPTYIVKLLNGSYFVRAERGADGTTTERAKATRFLVRDGEWNADGWAQAFARIGGGVLMTKTQIQALAKKTSDAYGYSTYGSGEWVRAIRVLADRGFNERGIENRSNS